MAILQVSNIFAESAEHLPKEAKLKLLKVFRLLTKDPRHPSLQLKKIEGALRRDVYECRVNNFWRLIIRQSANLCFDLVYVGPHDDAIRRGAMLRETETLYDFSGDSPKHYLNLYLSGDDRAISFKELPNTGVEEYFKLWSSL